MANYKELEGFGVQTLATDPDTPGSVGSIFYNSTSGTFKTVKPGGAPIGTWASGGDLNTARGTMASAGTQTAALSAGGNVPPITAFTEIYNGTSWTEVNDMPAAKSHSSGCGSTTAAIVVGGEAPTITNTVEEWDGTNWTAGGAYPGNITKSGVAGTQTAAISAFGLVDHLVKLIPPLLIMELLGRQLQMEILQDSLH
jgi:hypothetical protein